jgi:hypothetical protein
MQQLHSIIFDAEKTAYWFLRLNGFLTVTNFVVHPDRGHQQRTDVDILGCRFPYRQELQDDPMIDYELFTRFENKIVIVLAEVKSGLCKLNGPWTKPGKRNMQRVLQAIGCVQLDDIEKVATHLYESGFYEDNTFVIKNICFGSDKNDDLITRYKDVPQITWEEVLDFIYDRFVHYRHQKSGHSQWDEYGHYLLLNTTTGLAFRD